MATVEQLSPEKHDIAALEAAVSRDEDLQVKAKFATKHEKESTFLEAIRLHPSAVGWSMYFSLGILMASFDPQLVGNLFAIGAFQKDFGYKFKDSYIISAPWQTGLMMGSPIGQVVGAIFAGYPMDRYGRKKTFMACMFVTTSLIFVQFFARSLSVLLAGELLGGLVLGCYVVIAPAYASEVCPVALRGMLTAFVNLTFVTGQLIANGVAAGTHRLDNHWAYSIGFSIQWLWPLFIIIGMPFAPESPWWLARKGRFDEAEKSLRRLASAKVDAKSTLAMIIETDRLERAMEAGSTYWDCFKKINRRRTEVATGVYSIQVLSGIYLVGYATYFFQLAGLDGDKAFDMGIGYLALGWIGTVSSWFLMLRVGRRRIYNIGLLIMAIIMIVIGILDCAPDYLDRPSIIWAQSSLMILWNFFFDISIGPVAYVIFCEVSATRVRSKTIAFATAVQATVGIIMTVAIPYMINPDQANMRGKLGFFFGGLSFICLIWAYYRIPETKGRTFEELDIMFELEVPTREFKSYVVDFHNSARDTKEI
ncbi:hypothetical protein H2200_002382 [Cladophialophora chaetospira]|uniref:Major facilitator superfamily (MFS) profile domain-containing protein n=1 Tax=Cladophialophora chaetospira TaxID=386627 RepID=A0AA38XJQ6_9EURO|nr:hypothetical protein H2200_002382 [Cladophialophora chaetospira]